MRHVSLLMLSVWGVLALLGHSGTHALADWLGVCCHVDTGAAEPGRPDSQHHCRHCSHAADAAAPQVPDSAVPGSHDSENCRLCEWFFGWHAQVPTICQLLPAECLVWVQEFAGAGRTEIESVPAVSRGPPLA